MLPHRLHERFPKSRQMRPPLVRVLPIHKTIIVLPRLLRVRKGNLNILTL